MRIALCLITMGDEELNFLRGAVKSALPAVSSVHITANGKNVEKTKAYCEENGYDYSYLKWNKNFSQQRNFNFARAPKDVDYILWMDSDDLIVNADLIPEIARIAKKQGHDAVFFDYWYSSRFDGKPSLETHIETELTQKRERLLNPKKITWKKRIHETPVPLDGDNYSYTSISYSDDYPITWLHLGADRDIPQEELTKRMERNKELLELELEDERRGGEADPRTILYLMKVYAESKDEKILNECIELGQEYLTKSGWDQERAVCLGLMAKCIGALGDHEGARDFLMDAIKEYPYNPLFHLYLARAYFNLGDYRAMEFWLKLGTSLDLDKTNTAMGNILELKVLSAELMLEFYLRGKRDIRKAYSAAKLLNKLNPTLENQQNEDYLAKQTELDKATENIHKYMNYLKDNNMEYRIEGLYENLPDEIRKLPFVIKYYNRFKKPRTWKENEICYFANFGQFHVQKWDGNSLKDGIGGSETAVIRLSEELVKKGYRVVVYGDPEREITVNGVEYVPFYKFNQKDNFNIFIQWRHNVLAGKLSAKKFIVDLHDVSHSSTHEDKINHIDKIFVKSKYHRENIRDIDDSKVEVVSNGI